MILIAIENKYIFIDTLDAHIVYDSHQFMEFNFYRFLETYSPLDINIFFETFNFFKTFTPNNMRILNFELVKV